MRRHGRTGPRCRAGTAASEFAVLGPLLALLLFSLYDVSNALWLRARLEMAAQAGATYALSSPNDSAGITAAVQAQLGGLTGVTVGPTTMSCRCDDGTAVNCTTGTCTVAGNPVPPIGQISVVLTRPYTYVSPVTEAALPGLNPVRAGAEVRVR